MLLVAGCALSLAIYGFPEFHAHLTLVWSPSWWLEGCRGVFHLVAVGPTLASPLLLWFHRHAVPGWPRVSGAVVLAAIGVMKWFVLAEYFLLEKPGNHNLNLFYGLLGIIAGGVLLILASGGWRSRWWLDRVGLGLGLLWLLEELISLDVILDRPPAGRWIYLV
jgi:hypothetical protein